MMPRIIIRIENLLAVILGCCLLFLLNKENIYLNFERWYLIIIVWLSFDLSALGYLIDKKVGAFIYNLVHNYILASALVVIGFTLDNLNIISIGAILITHVGIDRAIGYGLKYSSDFKDTHMQKI